MGAENVDPRRALDLLNDTSGSPELTSAKRQIVDQFDDLVKSSARLAREGWSLIMYRWEVRLFSLLVLRTLELTSSIRSQLYKGDAKVQADLSDLVLCDKTQKKYVLINVAPCSPGTLSAFSSKCQDWQE